MRLVFFIGMMIFGAPLFAYAALTTGEASCTSAQPCGTGNKIITFYIPIATPNCKNSVQGCIETSQVGLNGRNDPITVDAVRLKKAQYATCASDPSNYRKYFNMGTITYRSALDMQMYTVPNVVCYVHDTGGAFRGRPDKLDLATTICPMCTDAQAMRIAVGSSVNFFGKGPVDADANATIFRAALANMRGENPYAIGSPYANVGGASPYTIGRSVPIGYPTYSSSYGGQVYDQDYYCVTSIDPVIVVPVPAGTQFPSNCYNNRPQPAFPPPPPPFQQQPQASPPQSQTNPTTQQANQTLAQQLLQRLNGGVQPERMQQPVKPAATLIAQPTVVSKGNPILLSWSSVGMKADGCAVRTGNTVLGEKNEGSRILPTGPGTASGVMTFTFSCASLAGQEIQKTASVTVN